MILYIHGFASSAFGSKPQHFKALGCDEPVLVPSLHYSPDLAIQTLVDLITMLRQCSDAQLSDIKLVGSSLGGYYAHYLARRFGLRAVLINPAVYPYRRLEEALGLMTHYYDHSRFEWQEQHLRMLELYDAGRWQQGDELLVLLQKGDELLDWKEAYEKLSGAEMVVEAGGSHSFEHIESHFERIASFLHVRFDA